MLKNDYDLQFSIHAKVRDNDCGYQALVVGIKSSCLQFFQIFIILMLAKLLLEYRELY